MSQRFQTWPRSRRSACFPAEAYPPLRPLKVYPQQECNVTVERKKSLNVAALSDMAPESALSLLPSRGLSSAPAAKSVSATGMQCNGGTKKELECRSAFRHGPGVGAQLASQQRLILRSGR